MSEKSASENWTDFLSCMRVGPARECQGDLPARTPYQIDYDRIISTSAFRRLQDKTQVFPLAESDFVRTRLTHSLEAASVGRALGQHVGSKILDGLGVALDGSWGETITKYEFAAIVAAACLAHDIGNPPFGHGGEEAIKEWFNSASDIAQNLLSKLNQEEADDFKNFDGNAQGFRVLTKRQYPRMDPKETGGLQLTSAVLASFTKYPTAAYDYSSKPGFFKSEEDLFEKVAKNTGLTNAGKGTWKRHPLSFLVEASDDICYLINDLEDGYRQKCVDYEKAKELIVSLVDDEKVKEEADQIFEKEETRGTLLNLEETRGTLLNL